MWKNKLTLNHFIRSLYNTLQNKDNYQSSPKALQQQPLFYNRFNPKSLNFSSAYHYIHYEVVHDRSHAYTISVLIAPPAYFLHNIACITWTSYNCCACSVIIYSVGGQMQIFFAVSVIWSANFFTNKIRTFQQTSLLLKLFLQYLLHLMFQFHKAMFLQWMHLKRMHVESLTDFLQSYWNL